MSDDPTRADPVRRGLLGAVVVAVVAVATGVAGRLRSRLGDVPRWRGFRRVKPWPYDQLRQPHDHAG